MAEARHTAADSAIFFGRAVYMALPTTLFTTLSRVLFWRCAEHQRKKEAPTKAQIYDTERNHSDFKFPKKSSQVSHIARICLRPSLRINWLPTVHHNDLRSAGPLGFSVR